MRDLRFLIAKQLMNTDCVWSDCSSFLLENVFEVSLCQVCVDTFLLHIASWKVLLPSPAKSLQNTRQGGTLFVLWLNKHENSRGVRTRIQESCVAIVYT